MNGLLALLGAGKIAWLYDPAWIKWGISLMAVWQGSAFSTIIYFYVFDYGRLMAGSMITIAPAILVYLVFQRFITRGVVMTGLKG